MKKLFVILMVSVFGFSAYAQDETVIQIQNSKGPYITTGIWDNWFVTAGGGIQVYFGESDTHGNFSDRIAPALDISVGKWITPSVGMRLQYSGLKAKGWTKLQNLYWFSPPNSLDTFHKKSACRFMVLNFSL